MEDIVNRKKLANLRKSIQKTEERMKNYKKKDKTDKVIRCLRELQDLRSREADLFDVKREKPRKRKTEHKKVFPAGSQKITMINCDACEQTGLRPRTQDGNDLRPCEVCQGRGGIPVDIFLGPRILDKANEKKVHFSDGREVTYEYFVKHRAEMLSVDKQTQ
jgi:hypothetical protein